MSVAAARAVGVPASSESPRRWRALFGLALATLLASSTWFSGTAVVRPLAAAWHLDRGATSWLTIAVQLGFVAGSLIAAFTNLLDLASPRLVFVGAAVMAAAVNALFAFAVPVLPAIALRFATGIFLAGIYPTAMKVMATWFVRERGRALGLMVGAITMGSALPHLVNAFGGLPWRAVILWTSALTLVGAGLGLGAVRNGPHPFPRARFDPLQAGRVLRDRGVRLACFGYFGHMWELYAMWAWFLVFFGDALERATGHASPATASLATFAVIGVGALGCWWGGIVSDRWGRTVSAAWALAISGLCAATVGLLHGGPPALLLALGLVWGLSVVADSAQFSTLVTERADPAYVGTALTLQLGIGFTLTAATLWWVPAARDLVGWRWTFLLLVPGPALGLLAMLRLHARPKPPHAAAAGTRS